MREREGETRKQAHREDRCCGGKNKKTPATCGLQQATLPQLNTRTSVSELTLLLL